MAITLVPNTTPAPAPAHPVATFGDADAYRVVLDQAKKLAQSTIVPEAYRGNEGNCLIAIECATRIGASPFMVMQNLHIIGGRPSWSSSFIIAAINACGRFSPLRFDVTKRGNGMLTYEQWTGPRGQRSKVTKSAEATLYSCVAWAMDRATGERLDGVEVTTEMAAAEGWWGKDDSKWRTMPELMIRYRAAAFFGRLYAPDILLGMQTAEEAEDIVSDASLHASRWQATVRDTDAKTDASDRERDFRALWNDSRWTPTQAKSLDTRWKACLDDDARDRLLANMRAQLASPAATERTEASTGGEQTLPQPAHPADYQDDSDLDD
jgi:hypothetical protein